MINPDVEDNNAYRHKEVINTLKRAFTTTLALQPEFNNPAGHEKVLKLVEELSQDVFFRDSLNTLSECLMDLVEKEQLLQRSKAESPAA